jgi:putative heme-binding domain-containing protein
VAALKSDNMFWRLQAQKLLVERGEKDVVPALVKLVEDKSVDAIGLNTAAIHAIWTLKGLGALDSGDKVADGVVDSVMIAGLIHPSEGVVQNALRAIPPNGSSLLLIAQSDRINSKSAQTRLQTLLALADFPEQPIAASHVVNLLAFSPEVAEDSVLLDAATAAGAKHGPYFLAIVGSGGWDKVNDEIGRVLTGLDNPAIGQRITIIAEHVARGGGEQAAKVLPTIATARPKVAEAIVAGLARGWPKDASAKLTSEQEDALAKAFEKASPTMRGQLVSLAARAGTDRLDKYAAEIAATFLAVVANEEQPAKARIDAASQLISLRKSDAAAATELLDLITPRTSPELADGLLDAVARSEAPEVGSAIVGRLKSWTPGVRQAALRVLTSRTEWTRVLIEGAEKGDVQLADLSLDQKQALATFPDKRLARRAKELLEQTGGLPNADRQKVLDELLPITKDKGDAAAGKVIFTKQCAKCHMHSGEGNRIGPDLTGMAVHPKAELLTHLIDPSRSVEGNFRVYSVLTAEGQVLTGLLASETKTAIELFDAEGKKHTLLREDIDQLNSSPKSLMPDGFEKQVSKQELTDLLEFLTQKGKYLPLSLEKVATINSTRGMFYDKNANAERLIFDDWKPKTFQGVPFLLVDPRGDRLPNVVMLYGPQGKFPPTMPRSVSLPCNAPAKAIHFLSGVSGWGSTGQRAGGVSLIVRLTYEDGKTEDHPLIDGKHFADYIRRVDVPDSKFAFALRGQQMRYLTVIPDRQDVIKTIDLVKGSDATAPIVMAVTVELAPQSARDQSR